MSKSQKIGIIGCGAFGSMIALCLSENGYNVTVFERETECFRGASFNNQNRLHLGFHYPRDITTARQCIEGFSRFCEEFPECIVSEFPNLYFIAEHGSQTNKNLYEKFCRSLQLEYEPIDVDDLPTSITGVSHGIKCPEVIYDCNILRSIILKRLNKSGVDLKMNTHITRIKKDNEHYTLSTSYENFGPFDQVINCTYADINRLTAQLGFTIGSVQYEYTWIPIVEVDIERVGITVMDGPFMTLLPFGMSNKFLMYHVEHSVLAREVSTMIDPLWLRKESSPLNKINVDYKFKKMKEACSNFVPALNDAKLTGFLQGPRMVSAKVESTDARPSLLQTFQNSYHVVFSGKIDHCVWISDQILTAVKVGDSIKSTSRVI